MPVNHEIVRETTPGNIVARLNSELRKVLQSPEVKNGLTRIGAVPIGNAPQDAATFMKNENVKWARVVKSGNLRLDSIR